MKKRLKELFSQRQILKNIILKELKSRYAGSLLGISWAIIIPLLIMFIINFVFTNVMKINIEYFPLFVLSAILPWMSFSSSLFDATSSITRNRQLLNQFTFPREIFPIASVAANFVNFLLGLLIMLPVFIMFKFKILPFLILLPFVIMLHFAFTVGLGLLLSCINVFFRDINNILEVVLMFWFWVTPVFYSVEMIPARFQWIYRLNPMVSYVTLYRDILFEAKFPRFDLIINAIGLAGFLLVIGYSVFIKFESAFLKRV